MIDKSAKVEDPHKKELLLAKKQWNEVVKLLIAKLIAFKRGVNGRGDKNANLPKVRVKEPFPIQYSTYLNSIADDYEKIIQGANTIIERQNIYSSAQIIEISDLIKNSSWWGSRFWARFSLLGLDKQERKLRLSMLAAARESLERLKEIEFILTGSDSDKIVTASVEFIKFAKPFINTFVEDLSKIIELEKSRTSKQLPPLSSVEDPLSSEQIIYEESPPQQAYEQIAAELGGPIDAKLSKIRVSNVSPKKLKELNIWYNRLTEGVIQKSDIISLREQTELLNRELDRLILVLNEKNSLIVDGDLHKIAEKTIRRWIQRKLMQINPGMLDQLVLKLVDDLLLLYPLFHRIMNNIENKELLIKDMSIDTLKVLNTIKSVARRMYLLASHTYGIEVKSAIREKTIRALNKIVSDLDNLSELFNPNV